MKASRCFTSRAMSLIVLLTAALPLCQCSMPPREAWQYIQTKGLLTYLGTQPSPPFRSGASASQRYASTRHTGSRPASTWFSNWSSGMPNRIRYQPPYSSTYSPNRYYNTTTEPRQSGNVASRSSSGSHSTPRPKSKADSNESGQGVRIPVDEPSPKVVASDPPARSLDAAPKPPDMAATPKSDTELPYGTPVPGRMNMVNSPFAGKTQLVDVSGMSVGQTVKCPYSGKLFKVPPTQQAANTAEKRMESKLEKAELSSEQTPADKKP